jgi:hypothetical protein
MTVPSETRHPECPLTLDLRQSPAETDFPHGTPASVEAASANGSHHRGNGSRLVSPQNVEREHFLS